MYLISSKLTLVLTHESAVVLNTQYLILVSQLFAFFFLLSGFKFPQSNQVTGLSYQQVFTHTARFWYFLLTYYFPLTYNLNCIKSIVVRHSTNHKGQLLKRVWVGQQGVNTWNRGRPSEDILFQKDWQQQKKGPIQFYVVTPVYVMLLHWIVAGILLVLLSIQIGIV